MHTLSDNLVWQWQVTFHNKFTDAVPTIHNFEEYQFNSHFQITLRSKTPSLCMYGNLQLAYVKIEPCIMQNIQHKLLW